MAATLGEIGTVPRRLVGEPGWAGRMPVPLARFGASALFTAPLAPILAAMVTVAAYSVDLFPLKPPAEHVLIAGTIDLMAAWLGLTLLHALLGLSAPQRVNATSYRLLKSRRDELVAKELTVAGEPGSAQVLDREERSGRTELDEHCRYLDAELRREGFQWVAGHGYIDLWRRAHRAEEAWLCLAPPAEVVEAADRARLSIVDSELSPQSARRMLVDLKLAVPERSQQGADLRAHGVDLQARLTVRSIWHALHTYRDDRWDGLLKARNRLLQALGLSAIFAYGLLWLAVLAETAPRVIQGATAVYFIGALFGVLDRLYSQSRAARGVDDYGLSQARLMTTPHLSGLAAVLGVTFVLAASPERATTLSNEAFNVLRTPTLVLAAVFGLSPRLLFEQIKKSADRAQSQLQSTLPAEGPAGAGEQ